MSRAQIQDSLNLIEYAGRISHRSEEDMTTLTWTKFISSVVLGHGDWSITEHAIVPVEILTDRGITHEIVRHRIASYTQESTRFVNYAKKMPPSFLYPKPDVKCPDCIANQQPKKFTDGWFHTHGLMGQSKCIYDRDWLDQIDSAEECYKKLLAKGWRPQEARSIFPNGLASKIICTYNLRTWRHIFIMRTTKEAHPQMKEVMIPLLQEFKNNIPLLYDDILPDSRQIDNLKLPQ
jgi:thymidylate synthase (FAD)